MKLKLKDKDKKKYKIKAIVNNTRQISQKPVFYPIFII